MEEMTPRERVYAALNFEEPDRVPIAFGGGLGNRIVESVPDGRKCSELYKYLGITNPEPIKIPLVGNTVDHPDERALSRLHSDIRCVWDRPLHLAANADGTANMVSSPNGYGVERKGLYDWLVTEPRLYMTTEKDIYEYPWPDPNAKINIPEELIERARHFHEDTDYFVAGINAGLGVAPNYSPEYFYSRTRWLADTKIRPKFFHKMTDKVMEGRLASNEQWFAVMGKYLDAAWVGNDLGTQESTFMSHNDYVEFYKPYQAKIVKTIRKYLRPEAKIILHCDGSIYPFIEDFIEIGIDVLSPIQPLAKNMEPWRLKRDFGGKISFMGGFDTQMLLPLGSVDEIREGAKKLIQEFAPGGGLIFAMSQNIQPGDPVKNVVAAFDAALEYGKYPIPEATGKNFVDFVRGLRL